jgi:hypothetical protein
MHLNADHHELLPGHVTTCAHIELPSSRVRRRCHGRSRIDRDGEAEEAAGTETTMDAAKVRHWLKHKIEHLACVVHAPPRPRLTTC